MDPRTCGGAFVRATQPDAREIDSALRRRLDRQATLVGQRVVLRVAQGAWLHVRGKDMYTLPRGSAYVVVDVFRDKSGTQRCDLIADDNSGRTVLHMPVSHLEVVE